MRVEVSPGRARLRAGPRTYEGHTDTVSTPSRSAAPNAAASPSCLESVYSSPVPPGGYGLRSVAARSPGAGPIDATLEVRTTRPTPARAASSTAMRGATAFTRHTLLCGREAT